MPMSYYCPVNVNNVLSKILTIYAPVAMMLKFGQCQHYPFVNISRNIYCINRDVDLTFDGKARPSMSTGVAVAAKFRSVHNNNNNNIINESTIKSVINERFNE